MAEPESIFDMIDPVVEAAAVAEAEAQIDAGQFVEHDRVMAWIKSWFTDKELPMPIPIAKK